MNFIEEQIKRVLDDIDILKSDIEVDFFNNDDFFENAISIMIQDTIIATCEEIEKVRDSGGEKGSQAQCFDMSKRLTKLISQAKEQS